MNVLITGASGFIGSHLINEELLETHNIAIFSREKTLKNNQAQLIEGDLANIDKSIDKIKRFNPTIIIHLAWQGIPDFSIDMCNLNLNNSIKFFNKIIQNTECKKIIISGSCFEYGKKNGECKESDALNINSYFTWAKNSLSNYLSVKCEEKNIILNWFRIFYAYGPFQRKDSLIPTLIEEIASRKVPNINTPLNKNDFIYVKDVANILFQAIDKDILPGIYNLGSGVSSAVYEICQIVEKHLMDSDSISNQVLKNNQNSESVNFWANMDKLTRELSPSRFTSLNMGIKHQINSMEL